MDSVWFHLWPSLLSQSSPTVPSHDQAKSVTVVFQWSSGLFIARTAGVEFDHVTL